MEINAKSILEEINYKIRNRDIFKLNREFLIQSLIKVSTDTYLQSTLYTGSTALADQVIQQFRAILKFIYSVENQNGIIPLNDNETINEFCKMIFEFVDSYTPVRNYLDQCIIGTREIKYDEEKHIYYESKYNDYSNYARMINIVKDYPSNDIKGKMINSIGGYLAKQKNKTNVFRDRFFYELMEDYKKICWFESEIKFDHDFGDFTYKELISFCAALKLIGDYYQIMIMRLSVPKIKYETMVYGIYRLTGLPKDKVKTFLKYQTYDYNYQKDKLSLIQSLIRCGDYYYFFPVSLNLGMLPVKMYRLLNDYEHEKYEKDFSVIAKNKEIQMTDEIVEKLKKYDLEIILNHKLKKGKNIVAEYDMLTLDNKTNNLYIFEFKWFFVGDGEEEHKRLDNKIKEAIKHRKGKDKYIFDNPQALSDELFDGKKINNIHEILISQNFSGNKRHDMIVIDYETLQWSIEQYDSYEELMAYFFNEEYRESIPVQSIPKETEIEGYKFNFYRLAIKREG